MRIRSLVYLLALLNNPCLLTAADTAKVVVTYELNHIRDTNTGKCIRELMYLYIGKETSLFTGLIC